MDVALRERARTPVRFRDRVILAFRAPVNLDYLRQQLRKRLGPAQAGYALDALPDAVELFASGEGRALDMLQSDPIARRGGQRPALDMWAEVRRLNRAFVGDRVAAARDAARLVRPGLPRDGQADDDEPYEMRMFIADSLRPPGLEHLNTPGPLYELREDQAMFRAPTPRERFEAKRLGAKRPPPRAPPKRAPKSAPPVEPSDRPDEDPWRAGDPNRTPEEAMAEYWGDERAATDTTLGAPDRAGQAYGDAYSWGDRWRENGGTRLMRYESIPFWQRGPREGCDTDIEETLGAGGRELDSCVRRWDMDRVRNPRGQEYRLLGVRN